MQKALFTIQTLAKINTRRFFRDRLSIFFGILFPLIFLFVFGGLFGGNSSSTFHIALIDKSDSAFSKSFARELKQQKSFKIETKYNSVDEAKNMMTSSQLDAAVVLPANFGVVAQKTHLPGGQAELYYTQNNEQAGQTLGAIMDGIFKNINTTITGAEVPFSVKTTALQDKSLTSFDYTFSGLLGFALLGIGIFGPVNVFPELKKMGILRRLSTTPLRVWQYFSATAISQTIIGLVSIVIMIVAAMTVFKLQIVGNIFLLALFIILSIIMVLGIGLAIGGWAKNERQAAPLSNIVVFPMLFLSGTFFPRFLMPEWLQAVTGWLPLTPVIDGIRYIATEGYTFMEVLPQLALIVGWAIVIYFIAFRVFRWE